MSRVVVIARVNPETGQTERRRMLLRDYSANFTEFRREGWDRDREETRKALRERRDLLRRGRSS